MIKSFGLTLGLMIFAASHLFAQEKKKTPPQETDTSYRIDLTNKKLQFGAELISSTDMLEVLACTRRGPTHEAVFLIPAIGKKLTNGLKAIGLNDAAKWQLPTKSGKAGFDLSLGNKVIMKVYWEGQKESQAIFVEDLLVYQTTQVPMMMRGWSFKGDLVTKDGKQTPANNAEISLINKGRQNSPVILLLNPSNFLKIDEPEYIVADKYKKLLKKMNDQNKTKGTITLHPATESEIVAMNIKRYPDDFALLKSNIPLAKEIDTLKEEFINGIRNKIFDVIEEGSDPKITKEKQTSLISQFKKIDLESQVALNRIHYLYYLMEKTELQVINKHMDQTKQFTIEYNIYSVQFMKFIAEEKKFIHQSLVNQLKEFNLLQDGKKEAAKKMHLQVLIDNTNAQLQHVLYLPTSLSYQIKGDSARLLEKDVIESVVVKDSITKSLNRKILDKEFYQKIALKEKSKITLLKAIQKDLSKESKATPELAAFKNATIDAIQVKLKIRKAGYENRLINLKEYLDDDPRDKAYYIKAIKKANDDLKANIKKAKDLEESRSSFSTDTTDCFTFENQYQKLLK